MQKYGDGSFFFYLAPFASLDIRPIIFFSKFKLEDAEKDGSFFEKLKKKQLTTLG